MTEIGGVPEARIIRFMEPRLQIKERRDYVAVVGASTINYQEEIAQTANSNQLTWNIITPNVKTGIDRSIYVDLTFRISAKDPAGNKVAPTLGVGGNLESLLTGFRQFPFSSIVRVAQLQLNNSQSFTLSPVEEVIHALMTYGNTSDDRQWDLGGTPHMPDYMSQITKAGEGVRNPFSTYVASDPNEDSRQVAQWATLDGNDIVVTFREPLWISPLYWSNSASNRYQALFNIQNISINFVLSGNLSRMFSGLLQDGSVAAPNGDAVFPATSAGQPVTVYVEPVVGGCKCRLIYLTPQLDMEVPDYLEYPLHTVNVQQQQFPSNPIAPNQPAEMVFNSVTLSTLPTRVYFFGRVTPPDNLVNRTMLRDGFAVIEKININFMNLSGRLGNADSYALWRLAVANGYKRSWLMWSKYLGSVLALDFGKDISLPSSSLAPSVRGNFQFQASVNFRTLPQDTFPIPEGEDTTPQNWMGYMVFVNGGVMTTDGRTVSQSIGALTQDAVANAGWYKEGVRQEIVSFYGDGILSDIWSVAKKAAKYAVPVARRIADVASVVAPMLGPRGEKLAKGATVAQAVLGRGGAKASRSSLASRC